MEALTGIIHVVIPVSSVQASEAPRGRREARAGEALGGCGRQNGEDRSNERGRWCEAQGRKAGTATHPLGCSAQPPSTPASLCRPLLVSPSLSSRWPPAQSPWVLLEPEPAGPLTHCPTGHVVRGRPWG